MSDRWDAIVIGSGIGGLTAGALYASTGKRVLVLERNQSFGGAASVYRVGDLTIEASLHELDGLDADDVKAPIFDRLGVRDTIEFINVGDLYEVRSPLLGEPFRMPHGVEAATAALTARFPRHEAAFRRYFARLLAVRRVYTHVGQSRAKPRWWRILNAPLFPWRTRALLRHGKLSLADVLSQTVGDDVAAKLALGAHIGYYGDDPARLWFPFWAVAQGAYHAGGGHYPRGGSKRLAEHLLSVIGEAGGEAWAGRAVTEIVLEDGRAGGVAHVGADGEAPARERAPVVFGNAAPAVLAELLPEGVRATFAAAYAELAPSVSLCTLALGLDRRPRELGVSGWSTVLFPDWVRTFADLAESTRLPAAPSAARSPYLIVVDYNAADSELTPRPPHLLTATGLDRAGNWDGDDETYHERRERWADAIVATLEREYPGLSAAIVQRELTTGRSVASYLNAPGGAVYGFATEPPRKGRLVPSRERTAVPGLYLASAYTRFGGYTGSIMGGALAFSAALRDA